MVTAGIVQVQSTFALLVLKSLGPANALSRDSVVAVELLVHSTAEQTEA